MKSKMNRTVMTFVVGSLAAVLLGGAAPSKDALKKRGAYLVTIGSCNDCHTPYKMGPNGPEPDMTRMLSGHPQEMTVPPPPAPAGPWIGSYTGTLTAWAGPWGISYTANLTPDRETGLGAWTEKNFIEAMRSGRHMGRGRPILPPMPWQWIGKMTDPDLRAVFAYLQSIPPLKNRVPDPTPPAAPAAGSAPAAPPATK